jgi:hypothetical protein
MGSSGARGDGPCLWARFVIVGADGTLATGLLIGRSTPDLAVVEQLATLRLLLRRSGGEVHLEEASSDLHGLLELTGLLREVGGDPEGREELPGVEEGMDPGDPTT